MGTWSQADSQAKRAPLPHEVAEQISAETNLPQTEQLWATFRTCYATEELAVKAALRNTGTILPYLNVPRNIAGSYEVLVEAFGEEAAQDVIQKNPGILQCSPEGLAQQAEKDPEAILRAAKFIDAVELVLEGIPPALRTNLDKVAFVLLAAPVVQRLAECQGG